MLRFQLVELVLSDEEAGGAQSLQVALDLALVIGDQERLASVGREHLEQRCLACDLA